jgi:hypothetical protein
MTRKKADRLNCGRGEYEELHETIRQHGRLIEKIQGAAATAATALSVATPGS